MAVQKSKKSVSRKNMRYFQFKRSKITLNSFLGKHKGLHLITYRNMFKGNKQEKNSVKGNVNFKNHFLNVSKYSKNFSRYSKIKTVSYDILE